MAKTRSTKENKSSADTPAAEAVIDGQLAGSSLASRWRQISPLTAGLVGAVLIALGLSVWPYMSPYLVSPSDDPRQQAVDQELAELRAGLGVVSDQQERLAAQLQTLQAGLTQIDETMADVVQSVSQSVDTVNAAIDRFDQQIAHIEDKFTAVPPADAEDKASAAPAQTQQQTGPADTAAADDPPQVQHDSSSDLLPDLALPDVSGMWQGLSDWFSGLVSVDRIDPEKSDAQ